MTRRVCSWICIKFTLVSAKIAEVVAAILLLTCEYPLGHTSCNIRFWIRNFSALRNVIPSLDFKIRIPILKQGNCILDGSSNSRPNWLSLLGLLAKIKV